MVMKLIKLAAMPAIAMAVGIGLAACGPASGKSTAAGSLLAKIPGCSQPKTWGGNSLDGTSGNGNCSLDSGALSGEIVKALIWPAGDTTDQSSYATSGALVGPGPCTIGGSSATPWVVTVQVQNYAPDYAASVYQTIASVTGGTSMGLEGSCIGTGGPGTPTAAPSPSATTDPPEATPAPTTAAPVAPVSTSGASDPAVTQANIHQTICVPGYTATVRPPESYTYALKKEQLAARGIYSTRGYVENHIIALELGGAPRDPANLAPELSGPSHAQDQVENRLHREVCDGQISLRDAQAEVVRTG